jgi:isoquinoline 1-oxidoreductase alpha subunit
LVPDPLLCSRRDTRIAHILEDQEFAAKRHRQTLPRGTASALPDERNNFMQFVLNVNGKAETVDVEPETPLLWVLRDTIGLTGTKYGCGIARCGACTIHVDGQPMKACQLQASAAVGKKITTIEGLSTDSSHPVQQAWVEIGVPQCGYCQSGQIMSAAALLARRKNPTLEEIEAAMADNLCRCGTYQRIVQAIHRASEIAQA